MLRMGLVGGHRQVASGTFTQADARMSLVDGTAFFDCGVDLSAYAGLDSGSHEYLIKVYDDDGNSIQGYVGAGGGGETLGAEVVAVAADREFTSDTGWWTKGANVDINVTTAGKCHWEAQAFNAAGIYRNDGSAVSIGYLYTITFTISDLSVGGLWPRLGSSIGQTVTTDGTYTEYMIPALNGKIYFYPSSATATLDLDDVSIKPVTDCAATGFHIISAQGGSTQNWQNVGGDFNYHDGDGYSYKVYKVR